MVGLCSDASLFCGGGVFWVKPKKCVQRALEDCQVGLLLKSHENFSEVVCSLKILTCERVGKRSTSVSDGKGKDDV